jgi:hypothetical protein
MIATARRLRRFVRSLGQCTSGLALTEFAMSVPVLLTLGLFGLETANYAMAHLRISNIAMMTADNAARVRDSIDEADVVELFTGAKMTGTSIDFAQNGRIILTDIEMSPINSARQWIRWQRCDGALNVDPTYGRPITVAGANITNGTEIYGSDRQTASLTPSSWVLSSLTNFGGAWAPISAQSGTAVMLVEVTYNYQPIIPNSFLSGRQIRYESAFNVRQRTDQTLRNIGRITPRSCNMFNA